MNTKTIIAISCLLLLIIFLVIFKYCFCPIFNQLPQPTGPYSVGTTHRFIVDTAHYSDGRNAFGLDIFYPTVKDMANKSYLYQPAKMNALKKIKYNGSYLPFFVWNGMLSNLYTYTQPEAPFVSGGHQLPVIIYLPGISGEDLHNTYLEELASFGYVIFAIEPPGDIVATIMPDGNVAELDPYFNKIIEKKDKEALYDYRNKAHERWNNYVERTLTEIEQLNNDANSPFYNQLDTTNLGLIGHSQGGAVVIDLCGKSNRCKAGINMDGWTKTYNTDKTVSTPLLFLLSQNGYMPEMASFFNNNQTQPDFKKVTIAGTGHSAFNDYILLKWPFNRFFGIVTAQGTNTLALRNEIKDLIVTFFNTSLKKGKKQ